MCGIFAYRGHRSNPGELVLKGLKRLEYRGYDSWGIAFKSGSEIIVHKEIGKIPEKAAAKIKNLESQYKSSNVSLALGHTRWATHGGVTEENAHPHTTEKKEVAVVHNGIIENFESLKKGLLQRGHRFQSETDTEVIAHLIEENLNLGLEKAAILALEKLEGRYAVLAICEKENTIIAARRGSPLIIGVSGNEHFIASDIPAFLEYTKKVKYLDDNQMVVIKDHARFIDLKTTQEIEKREIEIDWDIEHAEKGQYPHFMIKEIMEQKETIGKTINHNQKMIEEVALLIKKAFGTYLVGCGTAGKVCLAASYLFSKIAKRHVNTTFGSEFASYHHFLKPTSLLIIVSQSGETADTLEAIEVAKEKGCKIISIVNVESSTIARMSDVVVPIKVGPEKAVASTKATTAQLAILTLIAYACVEKLKEGHQLLVNTASQINDMLNPRYEDHIKTLAEKIHHVESMYIIGKDVNYPIALEAAIKLQEVSYIHAEGFAAGELKHGPIALISKNTPCISIIANDETKNDILSNTMEIKSRGGYIIGISPENNEIFDYWIKVPDVGNASPIVNIIPIQILAYHLSVIRQNDPDMPRNLAKSVTVK
ncbi:glutamine--fructose-6-phosphate transaminase (isomerizing) [Candidatus Peregrinibacteria bacterium]|nr:glutamine--fructose-6-phosphate transaminase (isomerizing) [Candidatus Peregrinibacteria bacterium]